MERLLIRSYSIGKWKYQTALVDDDGHDIQCSNHKSYDSAKKSAKQKQSNYKKINRKPIDLEIMVVEEIENVDWDWLDKI